MYHDKTIDFIIPVYYFYVHYFMKKSVMEFLKYISTSSNCLKPIKHCPSTLGIVEYFLMLPPLHVR